MYNIVSSKNCGYCEKARELLYEKGENYLVYSLDHISFYRTLIKEAGHTTVPQIWEDGVYVGGYNELIEHLERKQSANST